MKVKNIPCLYGFWFSFLNYFCDYESSLINHLVSLEFDISICNNKPLFGSISFLTRLWELFTKWLLHGFFPLHVCRPTSGHPSSSTILIIMYFTHVILLPEILVIQVKWCSCWLHSNQRMPDQIVLICKLDLMRHWS